MTRVFFYSAFGTIKVCLFSYILVHFKQFYLYRQPLPEADFSDRSESQPLSQFSTNEVSIIAGYALSLCPRQRKDFLKQKQQ